MALFKALVSFPHDSALPEDVIVNTFHFDSDDPIITDYDNVRDLLADFYTTTYTDQDGSVMSYYSGAYSGPATVKLYAQADPEPRTPVYTSTFAFSPPTTGVPLPSEVALVMSFGAAPVSGEPPARRRNRVYLGPFSTVALGTNGEAPSDICTDVAIAAREFIQASNASVTWKWVGYSPTDNAQFDIQGGWVDNAWDTQRRRGVNATQRVLFSAGAPEEE